MIILYEEFHWFSYVTEMHLGQNVLVFYYYKQLLIKESQMLKFLSLQTGDTELHLARVQFRRAGSRLNPYYCIMGVV